VEGMPSPFYRSLSNKNGNRNWAPFIVIGIVVILLVYLYWITNSTTEQTPQFITKPIPRRSAELVNAALVSSTGFVHIQSNSFEEKNMFYTTAGREREPVFLMIHNDVPQGSHRDWIALFESFANQGSFFAVDLINHGKSEPGPQTMKRVMEWHEHANDLVTFTQKMFPGRNDVILVAKGDGAKMAFHLAQQEKEKIGGMILFAPIVERSRTENIEDIPVLLVWAKEDSVVPFSQSKGVENQFFDVTTLYYESILPPGVSPKEAHNPEKFKLESIDATVQEWTTYVKQYRKREGQ